MAGRLNGKVALITGTGGGQGRAAALLFAREGARVAGCDLKVEGSKETVALAEEAGGQMISMEPVDLGDEAQVKRWIEHSADVYGGFDVLYNNAGAPRFAPIQDMTEEWGFTLRNELDLVYLACRHAWSYLVARGGGVIINTASGIGMMGMKDLGGAAHAAAKGGVISLTRQLAAEGAKHEIRANTITPGVIEVPAIADHPEAVAASLEASLIKRMGKPEDIAYCALYLAFDEAAYVTGANFVVDGGVTAAK